MRYPALLMAALAVSMYATNAQNKTDRIPSSYTSHIENKADHLSRQLDKKSGKALQRFQKQEARIKRKLARVDSLKAQQIFGDAQSRYQLLEQKLRQAGTLKQYIPSLDTLTTSLKFLEQHPQLLSQTNGAQQKLQEAIGKVSGLETQFQKAEEIKQFLKERKQYLKEQLAGLRFGKELRQLNKQTFYYQQQLAEYKALLKDHKKAERKALELLSKTKPFKDFLRNNSRLASLFRLPANPNDPTAQNSLAGLQTRVQVNNLIRQQLASGGPNARQQFQQNMQQAQNQINELKNKMNRFGQSSSDMEMPEGFKPNSQRTRSFLKRLEPGINIQSQKANGYWPVTSDIALSLGYRLDDRRTLGFSASYKLGLGRDIRHIALSHQGVGLRSFVDWKVKGNWWVSGGYELNYRSAFSRIAALQHLDQWQPSGLLGVSKSVPLNTKFFKKTKLQLLWDFLSYEQVPRTQPLLFRVGYTL